MVELEERREYGGRTSGIQGSAQGEPAMRATQAYFKTED
jgi:hypothetical protein